MYTMIRYTTNDFIMKNVPYCTCTHLQMLSYKDFKDTVIDDITRNVKFTTFVAIIHIGKEIHQMMTSFTDIKDTSLDVIIHRGKRCPQ